MAESGLLRSGGIVLDCADLVKRRSNRYAVRSRRPRMPYFVARCRRDASGSDANFPRGGGHSFAIFLPLGVGRSKLPPLGDARKSALSRSSRSSSAIGGKYPSVECSRCADSSMSRCACKSRRALLGAFRARDE